MCCMSGGCGSAMCVGSVMCVLNVSCECDLSGGCECGVHVCGVCSL